MAESQNPARDCHQAQEHPWLQRGWVDLCGDPLACIPAVPSQAGLGQGGPAVFCSFPQVVISAAGALAELINTLQVLFASTLSMKLPPCPGSGFPHCLPPALMPLLQTPGRGSAYTDPCTCLPPDPLVRGCFSVGIEAGSRVQLQPSCSSPPGLLLNLEKQWVICVALGRHSQALKNAWRCGAWASLCCLCWTQHARN